VNGRFPEKTGCLQWSEEKDIPSLSAFGLLAFKTAEFFWVNNGNK